MKDDLQKSDSCGLKSERKKILTSSTCSLACLSTNLGAFCPMVVHLPSEKSILPYFSGPRGVAILDCDSHSQAGSTKDLTRLTVEWRSGKVKIRSNKGQYWPKTLDKYLRHYHSPASKADWRRFIKKFPDRDDRLRPLLRHSDSQGLKLISRTGYKTMQKPATHGFIALVLIRGCS